MFPRALREIHQIEVTTYCNLRCHYCPSPKLQRPYEHMRMSVFERALEWCEHYSSKGTQMELSLTGLGESTLHPHFADMLRMARKALPKQEILFSTNGLPSFTEQVAMVCRDFRIGVYVSLHRPEMAGRTVELCKRYGIIRQVNAAAAVSAFDWAGQLDWFVSAPKTNCDYLAQGWGVVLVDGRITQCCIDAHGKGGIGHVNDLPGTVWTQPFDLCNGCHMTIPPTEEVQKYK